MKKIMVVFAAAFVVAAVGFCADFEAVSTTEHDGKTGLKDLTRAIDANNALLTAGTLQQAKITLGASNRVVVAATVADRSAVVVSTVTSNLPVGSVVIANTGKIYVRVAAAAATGSWYTVTSSNAE